jgi:uncharacterized protein (TIRG00374 family)
LKLRSLLILAVTLLLIYLALRQVGVDELLETVRQADPLYVVLAISMSPLLILVSVIKWHTLVKTQHDEVPFSYLFKLYIAGYFFTNFLPTSVGGDVVRVYELGSRTKDPAGAMASVFMERVSGFLVLMVVASAAFLGNLTLINNGVIALVMLGVALAFLGMVWMIVDARLLNFIESRLNLSLVRKYTAKFRKFRASLYAYKGQRRVLASVFGWSVVYNLVMILNVYVCASAFDKSVSLATISVAAPILALISIVPLTFNGAGIQEWGYVLLFTAFGMPASVGLSTILLIRAKTIFFIVIPGGLIYPSLRLRPNEVAMSAR